MNGWKANSDASRACPTATGPTTMTNWKSTWSQKYRIRMSSLLMQLWTQSACISNSTRKRLLLVHNGEHRLRWKPRLSYSHGSDDDDKSEKYLAAKVQNTYVAVAGCQCNYGGCNYSISRHRAHAFEIPGVFCQCTTANSDESPACPTATGPTAMTNRKSTWPQEYTTHM